jgi:hyperosmotically inducible periplasmic protein
MTSKIKITSLFLAVLLFLGGCTAMTGESAGQYADDSAITTRVKTALAADKAANLTRIEVATTNQVVSLNGIVQSPDQKRRAEEVAKEISGVRRVQNNLQIQQTR